MPNNILDDETHSSPKEQKQRFHLFEILHYGWLIASIVLVVYSYFQWGDIEWGELKEAWGFNSRVFEVWICSYILILFLFTYHETKEKTIGNVFWRVFDVALNSAMGTGLLALFVFDYGYNPYSMCICIICQIGCVKHSMNYK